MRYLIIPVLMLSFLSGCTTTQPIPGDANATEARQHNWKKRQLSLSKLASWKLAGRASVTYNGENWPFGVDWQQMAPARYNMKIKHPLTSNTMADVVRTAGSVSLSANGRTYTDSSAERLIEKHLKVRIPVEGMQYWVLGTAAPELPVTALQLDNLGRPLSLQQAGWTIKYSDYQSGQIDALPGLVQVVRATPKPIQVKMRVRNWSL